MRYLQRRMPPITRLIHYHVFKNAGTSVDEALRRSFGSAFMAFEGVHAHDIQDVDDIRRFIAANPDVRAIGTHLGRPPLPDAHALPIVFLRHPLLRARSVFEFLRRDPAHAGPKDAFGAFVDWCLDEGNGGDGVVMRDYQVVHLSDASFCRPSILAARATADDLAQACRLLDGFGVVGIVEEHARSAAVFQRLYGPHAPALDFSSHWLNRTTTDRMRPLPEMLAEVEDLLGPGLYARLAAANQLDLRLYAHGRVLLDRAEQGLDAA